MIHTFIVEIETTNDTVDRTEIKNRIQMALRSCSSAFSSITIKDPIGQDQSDPIKFCRDCPNHKEPLDPKCEACILWQSDPTSIADLRQLIRW